MTSATYTFFSLTTGEFLPHSVSCPESWLSFSTPAGCGAVEGVYKPTEAYVDISRGSEVCLRQPQGPTQSQDIGQQKVGEWTLSRGGDTHGWVAVLSEDGRAKAVRSQRAAYLQATDVQIVRRLEARLISGGAATPEDEVLVAYRQALRDLPARPDFSTLRPEDVPPPPPVVG